MKTCKANNCDQKVFSHDFCRLHQWQRKDEKYLAYKQRKKDGKIPIKRRSDKRDRDERYYKDQAREFFNEAVNNGTNDCIFCGEKVVSFEGLHHWRGRTNDYLLDKEWWSIVHNNCHVYIFHYSKLSVLEKQPWFESFMGRLKIKDIQAYNKIRGIKEKTLKLNPTLFDDED